MIGIVLLFITPKISESRDRAVVEQSLQALNVFDEKIRETLDSGLGNTRVISDFVIRRGEFIIDEDNDRIVFKIDDLKKPYSEPGVEIDYGAIKILSTEGQKKSSVTLTLDYGGIADLYHGGNGEMKFTASATPYSFSIINKEDGIRIVENTGG